MIKKILVVACLILWSYAMYQLSFYVIMRQSVPSCIERIHGEENTRKEVALDIWIDEDCELKFIIINNKEIFRAERKNL